MHIPGHLAVALIQHCLPPLSKNKKALKPLLLGSLFPDLMDKTIGYVLRLMPNGRHYAHNIFSLGGSSLFVALIWGKFSAVAWFLGYSGHLAVDDPRHVPWFFPLGRYTFSKGHLFTTPVSYIFKEVLFLGLVLIFKRFCR